MVSRYEKLSSSLSEISRMINRLSAQTMKDYGMRGTLAKYLLVMKRHKNGITASRLCTLCERNKADVSRALAELEELGLAEHPSGASYRAKFALTEQGYSIATSLELRASELISYVGKDITDEEREIFYRALESIAANLQAVEGKKAVT